jgi:eukaryotic-like serine/threonine-protein kinase
MIGQASSPQHRNAPVVLHERALIAGRYRVEGPIGSGGMGSVWLATDLETGTPVALKQAHPGQRPADREARIARDLRHPRIVAQYDAVVENGESWLVMQYVPSRDLATIIAEDGPLPPARVAHLGQQLAEALRVLQDRGVVHGDIAPGNVLITDDGDAVLTDFGVARAIWSDATVTAGSLVAGTPAYLAPEVARGEDRTPASDVFSLGATLFAAVEGVSPLGDAENPLTAVWRSASGHIDPPKAGPLGPALARMLRVDPAERPDPNEVRRLLSQADGAEPADPTGRRRAFVRTRTGLITAAVVVAVLVAGGLYLAIDRPWSDSKAPSDAPTPVAQPATLGDPRKADPCSLLRPSDLDRFGAARLVTDYGNFDRCDVLISKNDTDFADVEASLASGAPEFDGPTQRQSHGPVTVVSEPAEGGECDRFLLLRDKSFVVVTAKPLDDGKLDSCSAADIAASHAADVLAHGPIPPRAAGALPETSLANLNACSLVGPATFTKVSGLAGVQPSPGFGNWSCDWSADAAPSGATVRFDRNSTLTADDGQPIKLAKRSAFVTPEDDGPHSCLVSVVYRSYRNADGDAIEDVIEVTVDGKKSTAQLCTDARALAGSIVTKLPSP